MFEKLKKGVQKRMADMKVGKSYNDVFEIDGVPSFRQFYNFTIYPAKYVWKGFYTPWHIVETTTVGNQTAKRQLFRSDIAKAVCAELAGLLWNEQVEVHVSVKDSEEENDPLAAFVQDVLKDNAFFEKMQEHIEETAALGGGALKAYVTGEHNERGIKPGTEEIRIDYCMADQFVPTSWTNAKVEEAIFISRKAKGGYYYTKLEWHSWDGETYVVKNDLFRAEKREGDSQDILGFRYPLSEMYPELVPEAKINGLNQELFSYYRTPIANNVDDNSPLGISIYANAMDTLHALDICYDSFVREFRLGKKRIVVPTTAVRTVVDPETGEMRRFFDANDEAYEAFAMDGETGPREITTTLRVGEHVQAINAFLSMLCLQLGLSAGTFSFDMDHGLKTATEIISENSKTYKTIKTFQDMIEPAVKKLVENIIELGALYDIQHDGQSVKALASKGYDVKVVMQDAVLEDSQTKLNRGVMLMMNGLLSKKTLLTDPRYGLGMTEEEADAELERIRDEKKVDASAVDLFSAMTAE